MLDGLLHHPVLPAVLPHPGAQRTRASSYSAMPEILVMPDRCGDMWTPLYVPFSSFCAPYLPLLSLHILPPGPFDPCFAPSSPFPLLPAPINDIWVRTWSVTF